MHQKLSVDYPDALEMAEDKFRRRDRWHLGEGMEDRYVRMASKGMPKPSPLIYQGQSDYGNILDLDKPAPRRLEELARDTAEHHGSWAGDPRRGALINAGDHYEMLRKLAGDVAANDLPGQFSPLDLIRKELGYDALTHTGGSMWGRGGDPHQVVIGLDPKYRKFEQLPQDELARILGGENKAYDPRFPAYPGADRRLNEAADYIGPGYRPSRSIEEALGMRHGDDPHGVLDAIGRLSPAEQAALIGDLPEGMTPLGRGTEAWAGKTQGPNPWAVRVAPEVSPATGEPAYRAPIKGVLQPFRSNIFGEPGRGVQVEHLPLASTIFPPNQARGLAGQIYYARTGDSELEDLHNLLHDQSGANFREFNEVGRNLADYIRERYGYTNTEDLYHHPMNVAWRDSSRGMPLGFTHDAGAVEPNYGMQFPRPESPAPTADVLRALSGVNPQEAVRKAMERGAAGAMRGQGVRLPGLEEAISSDQLLRGLYDVASRKFEAYNRARGIAPGAR
jgi:hypothetical protein